MPLHSLYQRGIVSTVVFTLSVPLFRANIGSPAGLSGSRQSSMAVGKHAVSQAGVSFPVQNWNSPQGAQVHYTAAAAAGVSNDRRWSSALVLLFSTHIQRQRLRYVAILFPQRSTRNLAICRRPTRQRKRPLRV